MKKCYGKGPIMKKTILITIAVSVIVAVLFNGCKRKEQSDKDTGTKKTLDFALKNYDGNTVQLSDYKGQIVVLEWFNYECPFSNYHYEKANTMIDLAKKYKDKNVIWLAINSTNFIKAEQNEAYAKKHNIPYPILDDSKGTVGRAFDAQRTPHVFIIDINEGIAYNGAIDNAPIGKSPDGQEYINYVDKALIELTKGQTVSTRQTPPYGCTVKYANEL